MAIEVKDFEISDILKGKLLEAFNDIPDEFHALSDKELEKRITLTENIVRLRINFWREYRRCVAGMDKNRGEPYVFNARNIFRLILSEKNFYKNYLRDPGKMAYIMRPLTEFEDEVEVMLEASTQKIWQIINCDIHKKNGDIDVAKANLVLNAWGKIQDRARGLAVARQQIVQKTEHTHKKVDAIPEDIKKLSPAELDKQLALTEPEVIDVSGSESPSGSST